MKKFNKKIKKERLKVNTARFLEINREKEKELKEMAELDRIAKLLVRRDLELTEIREEQVKELREMDRIAKMLVRRDFELAEIREKREAEFKELEKKTKELEKSRGALMNILEDVEEAQGKAEEERNKTLAIITNFADGLLVFDKKHCLTLINPKAEYFLGIKSAEMTGKSISELSQFPMTKLLVNILGEEIREVFREELCLRENLILEVSTISIIREKTMLGKLVILHDITREKTIEKLKTEFVSLSAHQLRTPLSAIKWSLKMLLDGDLGRITKEQKDFIKKTYQSNERMIKLINDLLNVTRIEEGRYLYRLSPVNLEDIVQFVINSYKEELRRKKIKLIFKKPLQRLPEIKLDVEKIRLAVQNLLDNALRYTPRNREIVISLRMEKNQIEFSIKDTGIGIPKEQQKRVFSKFFRGGNAIKMATEGSGLGLFVTKNIIESHNGKIWFKSEENKGTTFYFTLPIKNSKIK